MKKFYIVINLIVNPYLIQTILLEVRYRRFFSAQYLKTR